MKLDPEIIRNMKKNADERRIGVLYLKPMDDEALPYDACIERYGDEVTRHMELYCVYYMGGYWDMNQWKDIKDITPGVLKKRLRAGWPFEQATNTAGRKVIPPGSRVPTEGGGRPASVITLEGTNRSMTLREWAKE